MFPYCPSWWCWLWTRHRKTLKYADYNADISGVRCRCGEHWQATSCMGVSLNVDIESYDI